MYIRPRVTKTLGRWLTAELDMFSFVNVDAFQWTIFCWASWTRLCAVSSSTIVAKDWHYFWKIIMRCNLSWGLILAIKLTIIVIVNGSQSRQGKLVTDNCALWEVAHIKLWVFFVKIHSRGPRQGSINLNNANFINITTLGRRFDVINCKIERGLRVPFWRSRSNY